MGLLKLTRITSPLIAGIVFAYGCSGLRLNHPMHTRPEDWPTFGRTISRSNVVNQLITPPLSRVWDYDVSAGVANGAPIIADSLVIVGTLRGELYAIRLTDGKRVGWISLGEAIHGTPVVEGGSCVIVPLSNSKESVVSYDMQNGASLWKQVCGDVETSLLLLENSVYFGTTAGTFYCVDCSNGTQRWSFPLPTNNRWKGIRSSPAGVKSTVVFGADDGVLYALNAKTGTPRWMYHTDSPIVAPPVIDSLHIIVGTVGGSVVALDPETGELQWSAEVGSPVYAHALLLPKIVVITTTGGELIGLAPNTGTQLWKTTVGSPMVAGPAAAESTLFVGTLRKEFLAVRISDGTMLWKDTTDGRIKTSPVISNGMIVVATDNQTVLAYRGVSTP
jgi:outer membrane protein assembly factor BamB